MSVSKKSIVKHILSEHYHIKGKFHKSMPKDQKKKSFHYIGINENIIIKEKLQREEKNEKIKQVIVQLKAGSNYDEDENQELVADFDEISEISISNEKLVKKHLMNDNNGKIISDEN